MEGQLNRGISIRREPCEAGEEPAGPQSVSLGTWFGSIRVDVHLHTWSSGLAMEHRHGSVSQQTVSFPATSSMRHTDASTPTRPSVPGGQVEKAALRLASAASAQVSGPGKQKPFRCYKEMSLTNLDLALREAGSPSSECAGDGTSRGCGEGCWLAESVKSCCRLLCCLLSGFNCSSRPNPFSHHEPPVFGVGTCEIAFIQKWMLTSRICN